MGATRVAFIGAGAMGGSIARGLVASGLFEASCVSVAEPQDGRRDAFEAEGHPVFADAREMLAKGPYDAVVLAVKPQVLPELMAKLAPELEGCLVVSIAAGVRIATIEAALRGSRVVRVMPNLPVAVLSGATAVCKGSTATPEDAELALGLFRALGSAQLMNETQLDVAGVVTG